MSNSTRKLILFLGALLIAAGLGFGVEKWIDTQAPLPLDTIPGIEVFTLIFVAATCVGHDFFEKAINAYLLTKLKPKDVPRPRFNLPSIVVFVATAFASCGMIYFTRR